MDGWLTGGRVQLFNLLLVSLHEEVLQLQVGRALIGVTPEKKCTFFILQDPRILRNTRLILHTSTIEVILTHSYGHLG